MDRRRFLTQLIALSGLVVAGCRDRLLGPVTRSKVELDPGPPGGGGGEPAPIGVFITVDATTRRYFVPWSSGLTVGQALDWAAANRGLDVGFGTSQRIGSRYVNRLNGVTVQANDVPTLLYAAAPAAFPTEDDWYAALAGLYVDLEPAPPAGGVVDWRLAVP